MLEGQGEAAATRGGASGRQGNAGQDEQPGASIMDLKRDTRQVRCLAPVVVSGVGIRAGQAEGWVKAGGVLPGKTRETAVGRRVD